MRMRDSGFREVWQKGFTLFEFAVVICVTAVLAMILLNRVQFYQEQVEKWTMVDVVATVQSALTLQQGHLLMQGEESAIAALAMANPMSWLAQKPRNYVGEFYDPAPGAVAPGKWAFDLKARELVYVPEHTAHLSLAGNGKKWIRYRVSLGKSYTPDIPGNSKMSSVSFGPVEKYRWEI